MMRDEVRGEILIHDRNTPDTPTGLMTKAFDVDMLQKHRLKVLGW
jgi:hypothetical protein